MNNIRDIRCDCHKDVIQDNIEASTSRKLKSPLDRLRYTMSESVRKDPHIAIFLVWSLNDIAFNLNF